MSYETLKAEIINKSEAQNWDAARQEWVLHNIWRTQEPDTCLCGHTPILEMCELVNTVNGNLVRVGNCCVKRFMGAEAGSILGSLKRVRGNLDLSVGKPVLDFAMKSGWISNDEHIEYECHVKRRAATLRGTRLSFRRAINFKILNAADRRERTNQS